ncbi:hypothetical protein E2C01_065453 [Portunus trituberculatus]|uniref:Uncharacterized protein n=1 Tax=Portunus trituberculatus TaxID=210409 RepID=A0A5B7HEM0_PORTR|nr:hypothetical protein [Portunus trituberculatus]
MSGLSGSHGKKASRIMSRTTNPPTALVSRLSLRNSHPADMTQLRDTAAKREPGNESPDNTHNSATIELYTDPHSN